MDIELRRKKAAELKGREVRTVAADGLEIRESAAGLTLAGWASMTERAYDMGWYEETISRGSFARTLNAKPDVQLLMNHEGLPLARTTSGTLRLSEDERGLNVSADLNPDDPDVQRLLPKVQRGDMDQMSFAFRVVNQAWNDDQDQRTISEVSLDRGDVSVVNYGANPHTSFSLRSLQSASLEDWERLAADLPPARLDEILPLFDRRARYTAEALADVFAEVRAGAAFSANNLAVLKDCLGRVADADDAVDYVLVQLSSLIGVPNPDSDAQQTNSPSYDLFERRLRLLSV